MIGAMMAFQALRKALGYGWSVAVAAYPNEGKPVFDHWLNSKDKDVRWVMKEEPEEKPADPHGCSLGAPVHGHTRGIIPYSRPCQGLLEGHPQFPLELRNS